MAIRKAGSSKWILILLAVGVLPLVSSSLAAAEIYVRPLVQYTWLPTSSRNAKNNPLGLFSFGGGVASSGPSANGSDYVASSSAAGFGLAIGAAMGNEHRFEVGAEATTTEFNGTYTLTPNHSYTTTGELVPAGPPMPGQPCSFAVTTVVATFRRWFGLSTDQVRPYVGIALGLTEVNFHPGARASNVDYYDEAGDTNITYGLGMGVRVKISRHFAVEASYRFLDAGGVFTHADFYSPAHVFSLAIDGRF
jgi:opacity protein-like surface antigen